MHCMFADNDNSYNASFSVVKVCNILAMLRDTGSQLLAIENADLCGVLCGIGLLL